MRADLPVGKSGPPVRFVQQLANRQRSRAAVASTAQTLPPRPRRLQPRLLWRDEGPIAVAFEPPCQFQVAEVTDKSSKFKVQSWLNASRWRGFSLPHIRMLVRTPALMLLTQR